jgi:DNA-binding XRE family transcriptional regulator
LISFSNECKLVPTMDKISLRHLRASLGLTQKQLSEEAGISEAAVIAIEKGKSKPRLITAYAIVDALNVKLEQAGREVVTVESIDWQILGE